MQENINIEVIIIGGSYAGLSAAMALGRSMRSVLIIDGGMPCNRQALHSHNFITQDGENPFVIAEKARKEVLNYRTVKLIKGIAEKAKIIENGFEIEIESGEKFHAKKIIFATGLKDIQPNIKGFAACWGISVIHCPYCHGYEFRNHKTGIIANGERAVHLAGLVYNFTKDITIFTSGKAYFNEEQMVKLSRNRIKIIENKIIEIEHKGGQVKNLVLNDGSTIDFKVMYAAIPFTQHSNIPETMGCELTEAGHVKVDFSQQTTVKGLFACGDNSGMMRSLANAVATGNIAGAMANNEITGEAF